MFLSILGLALFIWLFVLTVRLGLRIAWRLAKIVAAILCVIALPGIVLCLIFAGGALILLPLLLVGAAFGILKTCG